MKGQQAPPVPAPQPLVEPASIWTRLRIRRPSLRGWRRWSLWILLVLLVAALLITLVWLAGRYEADQVQVKIERDAAEAVADIRAAFTRNIQSLQALQASEPMPGAWTQEAQLLLQQHRELVRLEWRDAAATGVLAAANTAYRAPVFERLGRDNALSDVAHACSSARRLSGPAYAPSYFVPQMDGLGLEVMELCLPLARGGRLAGYLVATYSLPDTLAELVGKQLARGQEISFTEADGTRLALFGAVKRGSRIFTAQQLMDLPGNTLLLRIDSWRGPPDIFPNFLTALVTLMSIALITVVTLLGKDMRRRLRVERDLAEALAFRKAMEDSLVTGLRARDLAGRISYVNPAFCQMVGFPAAELLGGATPAPYWPPELVDEYQQRQAIRLTGNLPPREGFESVFIRRNGERFPVLIIEAPLINAQGQQTGWMSAILDVSEQRRVEEISRASQDRLQATARLATVGEMASLLSHELNQPLAAISSYATGSMNLLEAAPDSGLSADMRQAMTRIAEQAERAGKVIRSVHDFVRRRDQARDAVAPQALLDAIMPLVALQARKLGVRIEVQVEPDLPLAVCDRTMVEQVLLNLARNGMQAMGDMPWPGPQGLPGRRLSLNVRQGASNALGRWVEFAVADCGPGIPPEVARQIFTPFFTTKTEGMGLGLSLCRTVVEQHGGILAFEAVDGGGTIFRFTLPAKTPESQHGTVT